MDRYSLRALLSVGLLVVLAWLGIALFVGTHVQGVSVVLVVLWSIAVIVVLGFAAWNLMQGRRARLLHKPEAPGRRP